MSVRSREVDFVVIFDRCRSTRRTLISKLHFLKSRADHSEDRSGAT